MIIKKLVILSLLIAVSYQSLYSQSFIDTVYSVKWGEGQEFGRSEQYFPKNIFGPPDKTATKYIPAATEDEVCSLGRNGVITVGKKDFIVVDGNGPDFIIFENTFVISNGKKIFAEPGIISVSKDGINFIEFPFNSETLEGLAGLNWTNGDANCFDYTVSGGDAFDLATIGIDSIKYIRIKDTAVIASTLPITHKYYSPIGVISGFDLDAVVLLNIKENDSNILTDDTNNELIQIMYQNDIVIVSAIENTNIRVYDILGKELLYKQKTNFLLLNQKSFNNGIYFLAAENNGKTELKKIQILN